MSSQQQSELTVDDDAVKNEVNLSSQQLCIINSSKGQVTREIAIQLCIGLLKKPNGHWQSPLHHTLLAVILGM